MNCALAIRVFCTVLGVSIHFATAAAAATPPFHFPVAVYRLIIASFSQQIRTQNQKYSDAILITSYDSKVSRVRTLRYGK